MLSGATFRRVVALPLVFAAGACFDPVVQQRTDDAVYAWMQCQECIQGELARVVALGDTAVPRLRAIALDGPPPTHVLAIRAAVDSVALRMPAAQQPSVGTRAAQVARVRALYRVRAASALGEIGSAESHAALCAARGASPPTDATRDAIDRAVTTTGQGACP